MRRQGALETGRAERWGTGPTPGSASGALGPGPRSGVRGLALLLREADGISSGSVGGPALCLRKAKSADNGGMVILLRKAGGVSGQARCVGKAGGFGDGGEALRFCDEGGVS